jgi:cold shock CspA family protein
MGRSQQTFRKKEVQDKKGKKRKDKEQKRLARKENKGGSSLDDMIAYVDENGMITSTPPDPTKKKKETKLEDIEIGVPKREEIEEDPIRNGILVFFNDSKGYGFIRDLDNDEKVFVHINNMIDEIVENNKVIFEIENGPKGPTAVKVKKHTS